MEIGHPEYPDNACRDKAGAINTALSNISDSQPNTNEQCLGGCLCALYKDSNFLLCIGRFLL